MRKITLLFFIFLVQAFKSDAQFSTEVGINAGASNYLGDIGGLNSSARPWLLDMKTQETRWAFGGYLREKINTKFFIEEQFNWIRICGADSLSSNHGRKGRNLFFRNDIEEVSILCDWVFYQLTDMGGYFSYKTTFSAYLTGGISGFHHNPQTEYKGQWVDLQPLHTEGVDYSLYQPGIPMGVGFFYTFNRQYRFGWNLIWTETFTDYLDDVSNKYVALPPGSTAAAVADRSWGVPGMTEGWAANYLPGNKRGDPRNDDSFLTTELSFGYVFKGQAHHAAAKSIFNYRSRSTF
jgi:hypothetical protein